jgi:sec-independent protein translocase protein TatC
VLYMALLVSAPWWLYQLWAFVAPGLHRHERKWAYGFAAVATPLFLGGAVLAYLVVHRGLEFLLPGQGSGILTQLPIANYVNFVLGVMVAFGAAFEFPLVLVMLNVAGLVSGQRLLKWWRISVFLMFVAAAVITPTPDPFGMTALALPMVALYFGAVGFAFLNDRRKARKQAAEYGEVGDDEASQLDYSADPIDELEPVGAPEPIDVPEQPSEGGGRVRRSRRFDDST